MVTKTKYHQIFIKKQKEGSVYMTRAFRKYGMDKVVLCPVDGHTQKDAYEILKNLEDRYSSEGPKFAHKLTVGDLWDKYIAIEEDRFKAGEITHATLYEKKWTGDKMLMPFFKDVKIKDMNYGRNLWSQFVDKQTRKNLYHPMKVFRNFLNWCKQEDYLDRVIDLLIPKYDERKGKDLGWDLALTLRDIASGDIKDFITLGLLTGMRRNEIVGLSWDRVYFDTNQILTKDYESRTKPKRIISFNDEVLELLERRKSLYPESPWVFPHADDKFICRKWDGMKRQWKKLLDELELEDVRPQDLRVTWENEARRQGVPEALRLKYAGHSKDVSDEHYMRYSSQELKLVSDSVRINRGTNVGLVVVKGA
jgi:integrase